MFEKNKKVLKEFAASYKLKKAEFDYRHQTLIKQFNLSKNEKKQVSYGILVPANRSLIKYTDILNSDLELNRLHNEFKDIFLAGNMLLIKIIEEKNIKISGYNLKAFVENPKDNFQEIENLIYGLHGYKHIHTIQDKVTLEIPARHYIKKHPNLIKLVDYWFKKLDIFTYE
ncbi:MAG: hypothetical protein GX660_18730 [Clostridiaceae bacterium]|nr:hypothetical protein [Clostridiaceae bacterium]